MLGGGGFKIYEKNVYIVIWPLVGKKNGTKMFNVRNKSSIFHNWILLQTIYQGYAVVIMVIWHLSLLPLYSLYILFNVMYNTRCWYLCDM